MALALLGLLLASLVPELDAENLDQLEPLWAAGSNLKGELASALNMRTSLPNYHPVQIMGFGVVGEGRDVISVTGGRAHGLATVRNSSLPESEGATVWGWGDNTNGQLGPEDAGAAGAPPRALARSLFPAVARGNEITATERAFTFSAWDADAGGYTTRAGALALGLKSLQDIEDEVNAAIGEGRVLALTTDPESERVRVAVTKPGFQVGLPAGLGARLGHAAKTVPADGLLCELSARLGNNVLSYRNWTKIASSRAITVRYRAWDPDAQQAATYEATVSKAFPPYDPWTPAALAAALNARAAANGHPATLFDVGGADIASFGNQTIASLRHAGSAPAPPSLPY